jgi:hypothetical protein
MKQANRAAVPDALQTLIRFGRPSTAGRVQPVTTRISRSFMISEVNAIRIDHH